MSDPRDEVDEASIDALRAKARELNNEADRIRAEIVRRQFDRKRAALGSPAPVPFNERAERDSTGEAVSA